MLSILKIKFIKINFKILYYCIIPILQIYQAQNIKGILYICNFYSVFHKLEILEQT